VDAALILLGALVRVELDAGKVLLDGGILLGHGAELIIQAALFLLVIGRKLCYTIERV